MPESRLLLFQQYYRAAEAVQDLFLFRGNGAYFPYAVNIPAHKRKGLFVALLAAAQLIYDILPVAAAGKMYAAETLDGDYLTGFYILPGKLCRVAGHFIAAGIKEEHTRAAIRTAVRLRMVAPVLYVMVFPVTVRAHRKRAHRGLGPVVRNVPDDRKARAAVGAVYERVPVAAVSGSPEFTQAVTADTYIRGNERIAKLLGFAAEYPEILIPGRLGKVLRLDLLDHGEDGGAVRKLGDKTVKLLTPAFKLQLNARGRVLYISFQPALLDKLMDKGAKTHALHYTVNMYKNSFQQAVSHVS